MKIFLQTRFNPFQEIYDSTEKSEPSLIEKIVSPYIEIYMGDSLLYSSGKPVENMLPGVLLFLLAGVLWKLLK